MALFTSNKKDDQNAEEKVVGPIGVNPEEISHEKQQRDLEKLMEFQMKIEQSTQRASSAPIQTKPEDEALKLKNPFRGE